MRHALPWSAVGDRLLFAIDWFVEGKFYSVFSMLLGVGFALQAARAERRGDDIDGSSGGGWGGQGHPRDRHDADGRRRRALGGEA